MTKSVQILIPNEAIAAFCVRWKVQEFALFGSVLTDHFGPESDIDVLLTFTPDETWTLFDQLHMREELIHIFERPVDVLTRRAVEKSRNPLRRNAILQSAQVIHAA